MRVLMARLVALMCAVLMQSFSDWIPGSLVVQQASPVVVVPSGVVAFTVKCHMVLLFSWIRCFPVVSRVIS